MKTTGQIYCINTALIVISLASVIVIKFVLKIDVARIGACYSACLNCLKSVSQSSVQLNYVVLHRR